MGFEHKSRLVPATLLGEANSNYVVYDDIQINDANVIRPGVDDPTWRTYDFGLGGPAFSVLGFALNDYVDFGFRRPIPNS